MLKLLAYPFDPPLLSRKRKELKRRLSGQTSPIRLRIAILGESTTSELTDFLNLFLLNLGISATFYDAPFGGYYDEVFHRPEALKSFSPDLVVLHLGLTTIKSWPTDSADYEACLQAELARLEGLWSAVWRQFSCSIIQSNLPLPPLRSLGNLEASDPRGRGRFVVELNSRLAQKIQETSRVRLNDVHFVSCQVGLENYFDKKLWHSYRILESLTGSVHLAHSLAGLIGASYGRSRKCLVVDLDNTLWGGIIGEEGPEGIILGVDLPAGEAYLDFQQYLKDLQKRGILLAICSKNEESRGLSGLAHPDSRLRREDFSAFRINWQPKHRNLIELAQELSLSLESFVFVDDNPAEREEIRALLPQVAVPELGDDIANYSHIIDGNRYFESVSLGQDDLQRSNYYALEHKRQEAARDHASHEDFLNSLHMVAEITPFQRVYLDRISQLTNKTNQFNLTTMRCSLEQISLMADSPQWITLCGRLQDKFGDHGLVSVLAGEAVECSLHLRLWLMSCRVLGRGMEYAMFESLVEECRKREIATIYGYFVPTDRNSLVESFYPTLGFTEMPGSESLRIFRFVIGPPGPTHSIERIQR